MVKWPRLSLGATWPIVNGLAEIKLGASCI